MSNTQILCSPQSTSSGNMHMKINSGEKIPSDVKYENVNLDTALSLTGYGRFHYKIVAASALCLLSSGLQNNLSAYVLPGATCELELKTSQIGLINAAFLVGGLCSSFLWGVVGDMNGRRVVLLMTILLDVVTTTLCAFMQNFTGLVICRFLSGFLMGAPGTLTFTYLAEFHAPQHRSKSIYYSGVFFSFACTLLPFLAWLILPLRLEVVLGGITLVSSWRVFLILLVLPEILAGLFIYYLPETPKFLANVDQKKALMVLQQIYAENAKRDRTEFPVKNLESDVKITSNAGNGRGKIARIVAEIVAQIKKLIKPPLLTLTLISCGAMGANMFGYFGLGLWLPQLLSRLQEYQRLHSNESISLNLLANYTQHQPSTNQSCIPKFDTEIFQSTLSIGGSALIGNVLSGWFAGRCGHKVIPLVTMFLGAVSAGSIYWLTSPLQNLVADCVFQSAMTIGNLAIGCVIVELFPTAVSAIAICTAMFVGRGSAMLSNVIFGFLMDYNCEIAVFSVAGVLLVGTALCLMIPSRQIEDNAKLNQGNRVEVSVISITSM